MDNDKQLYYKYNPQSVSKFLTAYLKSPRTGYFETKEEAHNYFKVSKDLADKQYVKLMTAISKIKSNICDFSYEVEVDVLDDSGLDIQQYIQINVNGFAFRYDQ